MALTKSQESRVIAHINKVWQKPECSLCGTNSWATSGVINLALTDSDGFNLGINQQHLPCVAAVCTKCGNTVLINLKVATEDKGPK